MSKLKSKIWQKDIDNLNNRYKQLEEKCVNEYISETYKKKLKKKIDDIKLEGSKETIKAIEDHFPDDEIKIPYQDLLSKAHTIIENLSGCGNIKLKIEEDKIENLAKNKNDTIFNILNLAENKYKIAILNNKTIEVVDLNGKNDEELILTHKDIDNIIK